MSSDAESFDDIEGFERGAVISAETDIVYDWFVAFREGERVVIQSVDCAPVEGGKLTVQLERRNHDSITMFDLEAFATHLDRGEMEVVER